MVNIVFTPGAWHATGSLKAEGHAGHGPQGEDLVCAGLTALLDGLAANLMEIPGLAFRREARSGFLYMRWSRESGSDCIRDANRAAWHFYRALNAMSREYPDAVRVRWNRQEYFKPKKGRTRHEQSEREGRH